MQLVSNARHLEVQVLGDAHGNAIALHGRDCSIQRRHQKIVEEGPPIAAKPDTWTEMERGAVRLAKQVGYVSAGTVEYLYRDGEYFFLELNPRLQVEHPVTEEIMQVNMPACQLMVAMGLPLYRIRALRVLYNADPDGAEPIDFDATPRRAPSGHCIAVRITGENPDQGFKPTSGRIDELTFRSSPNVWGYFSVGGRGGIHEYADSQFGHVFARGATRNEARIRMVLALREISIRGEIRTPVEYLAKLLESDDFKCEPAFTLAGSTRASPPPPRSPSRPPPRRRHVAVARCRGAADGARALGRRAGASDVRRAGARVAALRAALGGVLVGPGARPPERARAADARRRRPDFRRDALSVCGAPHRPVPLSALGAARHAARRARRAAPAERRRRAGADRRPQAHVLQPRGRHRPAPAVRRAHAGV
jgi:hypothetical protein